MAVPVKLCAVLLLLLGIVSLTTNRCAGASIAGKKDSSSYTSADSSSQTSDKSADDSSDSKLDSNSKSDSKSDSVSDGSDSSSDKSCQPVDGGWTGWTPSPCELGQKQKRKCANPKKKCGGSKCDGPKKRLCDNCSPDPCHNGATCLNENLDYTCVCQPGFTDKNCSTDINECASSPCLHGTCNDKVNGYTCHCAAGYVGVHCETDMCMPSPCQNGGTCNHEVNGYGCVCAPGYTGVHCETDIDECASTPCQNGGTCNDKVNGYTCSCESGYEGDNCQTAAQTTCTQKAVDVVFAVDESGSVGASNFQQMLDFLETFVNQVLNIEGATNPTRMGMLTFDWSALLQFDLNQYQTKAALIQAIQATPYNRGSTNIAAAISYARDNMFQSANGDRQNAPNYLIVMTDGYSSLTQTTQAAQSAHQQGIHIIAVGIGSGVHQAQLDAMATPPASDNVLIASDFSQLAVDLQNKLASVICQ